MKDIIKLIIDRLEQAVIQPHLTMHPNGRAQVVAVRDGYTLATLNGNEDQRPAHAFTDSASLAAWLLREADAVRIIPNDAAVLVGANVIQCTFDAWQVDLATVSVPLVRTPAWNVWRSHFNTPLTTGTMLELVRSVRQTIKPEIVLMNGQERAIPGSDVLLAGLSSLDVTCTGGVKVKRNAVGMITVDAATEDTVVVGTLPELLHLRLALYMADDCESNVEVIVSVRTKKDDAGKVELVWHLRCPLIEQIEQSARGDIQRALATRLGEGWLVGLGESRVTTFPGQVLQS